MLKEELKLSKINLYDIDRDADLTAAIAELWLWEKHLNDSLNYIVKQLTKIDECLEKQPNDKTYEKLKKFYEDTFELASALLKGIRIERAKHLRRITKLKEISIGDLKIRIPGLWCGYKHATGGYIQFGEVGAKDIHMGEMENAKLDFETSEFCKEAIILLNKFAEKYKKESE